MKNQNTNIQSTKWCKKYYMQRLVNALHMDLNDFMGNVSENSSYELMIYRWINKLYRKGKPMKDALELIYRARIYHYLRIAN